MAASRCLGVALIVGLMPWIAIGGLDPLRIDIVAASQAQDADVSTPARSRAWALLLSALCCNGIDALSTWYNEAEMFAADPVSEAPNTRLPFPGLPIGAAAMQAQRLQHIGDAPLITFVHYSPLAYEHIRRHQLNRRERLDELLNSGPRDPDYPDLSTIPALPDRAYVVMSAWWPVADAGMTPLPVWDPAQVPRPDGSNDYTSWPRAVAVSGRVDEGGALPLVFAGRAFSGAQRTGIDRFIHLRVDQRTATNLMDDTGALKAALLVLGRPLRAGDSLALIAFHLMSPDAARGTWTTFWWHDQPDAGDFAADRPHEVLGAWRNYLMDVAVDPVDPREPDGSPQICFNPWFEARFPDGGDGNGLKSNCIACHERASYPVTDFLPVRRGLAEPGNDPAFASGRLRTDRLWSLANPPPGEH